MPEDGAGQDRGRRRKAAPATPVAPAPEVAAVEPAPAKPRRSRKAAAPAEREPVDVPVAAVVEPDRRRRRRRPSPGAARSGKKAAPAESRRPCPRRPRAESSRRRPSGRGRRRPRRPVEAAGAGPGTGRRTRSRKKAAAEPRCRAAVPVDAPRKAATRSRKKAGGRERRRRGRRRQEAPAKKAGVQEGGRRRSKNGRSRLSAVRSRVERGHAYRHLERQLAEGPPAQGGGVAGLRPARRAVHAGDQAGRQRLPGPGLLGPRATSRPTAARASGTGWPSSAGSGSTTSWPGSPTRPRTRRPRPGCCGRRAAASGWPASTCPTAARSAASTTRPSWPGSTACAGTSRPAATRASNLVICGDFNVAPEDRDVWDPAKLHGGTHISPPEREAVGRPRDWGLVDVFRQIYPEPGRLLVVGLPGRRLPPGPGPAHRPGAGHQAAGRAGHLGPHRPPGPQGQASLRPRPPARRLRPLTRSIWQQIAAVARPTAASRSRRATRPG